MTSNRRAVHSEASESKHETEYAMHPHNLLIHGVIPETNVESAQTERLEADLLRIRAEIHHARTRHKREVVRRAVNATLTNPFVRVYRLLVAGIVATAVAAPLAQAGPPAPDRPRAIQVQGSHKVFLAGHGGSRRPAASPLPPLAAHSPIAPNQRVALREGL
jgi:hypothetical protein